MKKTISGIFVFTTFFGYCQSNVVATGGNATGTGGAQSYTVGQIDYINSSSSSGNTNQGVQQPFEFYNNSASIEESTLLGINLYPNPTNEFIVISLNSIPEQLTYKLTDISGRLIAKGAILSTETTIDVRDLSAGTYHLSIIQKNQQFQSIKIVKN